MNTPLDINVDLSQEPTLVGETQATEEQQKVLDDVMDTMEEIVHGQYRDHIVNTLDSHPDLWKTSSHIATSLITRVAHKLDEQQKEYDPSIFFGQNGAIQQTVEMLWEMSSAMGHPAAEDDTQMETAYLATLQQIGDMMVDDEESAKEAQAFILQQEMGEDVVSIAAEEMEAATQMSQLAENTTDDPSLWDITKVRSRHLLENIGDFLTPELGPSRDPNEESNRRSLKGEGHREMQLRDELDPNVTTRRRLKDAGVG